MEKTINYPITEKAYLIGMHHYCYRGTGSLSEIIGVKMGKPDKESKPRLVYEVEYSDGVKDMVAVSDIGVNYKIITFPKLMEKYGRLENIRLELLKTCYMILDLLEKNKDRAPWYLKKHYLKLYKAINNATITS